MFQTTIQYVYIYIIYKWEFHGDVSWDMNWVVVILTFLLCQFDYRIYNINYKSNSQPMNTESAVSIQIYNVVQGNSN